MFWYHGHVHNAHISFSTREPHSKKDPSKLKNRLYSDRQMCQQLTKGNPDLLTEKVLLVQKLRYPVYFRSTYYLILTETSSVNYTCKNCFPTSKLK